MSIVFNRRYKHDRLDFLPTVPLAFEDPDAAPFFLALGVAEESELEPVVTYGIGEIDIHPLTVWNNLGDPRHRHYVMPERAAAHRGITVEEAQAFVWSGEEVDAHG